MTDSEPELEGSPGHQLELHRAPEDFLARAMARADERPTARVPMAALLVIGGLLGAGASTLAAKVEGPPVQPGAVVVSAEAPAAATEAEATVGVRFVFSAPEARSVSVAGNWNAWSPSAAPMHRGENGTFFLVVPLSRGQHEYLFVVDGQRWVGDPAAPLSRDDGFGQRNSVLTL